MDMGSVGSEKGDVNMKKRLLVLLLAMALLVGTACSRQKGQSEKEDTEAPCDHVYTETETRGIFADKQVIHVCTKCGDTYTETTEPATKSLKILAIGNSFNNNSSSLLYDLASDGGAEDIVIGCLWIGGSTLQDHAFQIKQNAPKYEYRKNSNGTWNVTQWRTFLEGLQDEKWDFIVLNQGSIVAGQPDQAAEGLDTVVSCIRENANPGSELWFNMTWAYDADSTSNPNFAAWYNSDPQTMYEAVRDTSRNVIMGSGYFDGLIPCGTTMQNLRTSWAANQVTQDGHHASNGFGCYALGLTWLATLTDIDVSSIQWFPKLYSKWGTEYEDALRDIAKEAVIHAVEKPYEVTQSSYTEKPEFQANR